MNGQAVGKNGCAFEGVLQFADVARPAVMEKAVAGTFAEFEAGLGKFATEFFQEMIGEQQHVVSAIAQWRNGHGHGGDAKV